MADDRMQNELKIANSYVNEYEEATGGKRIAFGLPLKDGDIVKLSEETTRTLSDAAARLQTLGLDAEAEACKALNVKLTGMLATSRATSPTCERWFGRHKWSRWSRMSTWASMRSGKVMVYQRHMRECLECGLIDHKDHVALE